MQISLLDHHVTFTAIRRTALPRSAETSQRAHGAGITGRLSSAGHHPARSSIAGQGSNFPDPGHYSSQRGLKAAMCVAWIILLSNTVAMVALL